jgi:hypothetical protein
MRADGDGRYCERCSLHVTDVASLDADGLERLLASAVQERVCARFELERGQPRTKLGLAAGLIVIALAGCTTSGTTSFDELVVGPQDSGGVISGVVRGLDAVPLANAVVVLQSDALAQEQELLTNQHGLFAFDSLAAGNYTIHVFAGKANVSKIVELPKDARFRANFSVDPNAHSMMGGMLVEPSMIDTSSASSTYSSRMVEYE